MRYLSALLLIFICAFASAQQGVAINTDGSTPDINATLRECIDSAVYGSTRYTGTASYVQSGKMLVQIENIKAVIDDPDAFHANDDKTFYFIIYNY